MNLKLPNIDEYLRRVEGECYFEGPPDKTRALTCKHAIIMMIEAMRVPDSILAKQIFDLGQRIREFVAGKDKLTPDEAHTLSIIIRSNPMALMAHLWHQLIKHILESKETA